MRAVAADLLDLLDEVEDRDSVADRTQDAVAIRREDDVALPVDRSNQVRELPTQCREGVSLHVRLK